MSRIDSTLDSPARQSSLDGLVSAACPIIALSLGALQAWGGRHLMNPDGVSYIDIADAYSRGEWPAALNSYWNPLYSWILAIAFKIGRPSPSWEFQLVHAVNFAIYAFAVYCFALFLRSLRHYVQSRISDDYSRAPMWAWALMGYSAFTLLSLEWAGLEVVSPDLCAQAFLFLAAALLLRSRTRAVSWTALIALGVCLGATLLTKIATAIPVVITFTIGAAAVRQRGSSLRAAAVLFAMVLVCAPYFIALSVKQGRFTISDTGTLNYAWYVNGVPNHWLGEMPGLGTPAQPHQRVLDVPAAYSYDPAAAGTYPGWFDPARWFGGVRPRIDLKRQLYAVKDNASRLFTMVFGGTHPALICGVLSLVLISSSAGSVWQRSQMCWFLILPAILAVAMYGFVWIESRFLAGVMILFWMGVFSAAWVPDSFGSRTAVSAVVVATAVVILASVGGATVIRAYEIGRGPANDWIVAEYLNRNGVSAGARVAAIGHINRCGWARLARVKITAEIPHESEVDFDTAPDALKARALAALLATGVQAVVADHRVEAGCGSGWQHVGTTGFSVCAAR
jgi:4-amino-4-deoxy-L-arabinose transferase-like glycosyltransferase